MWPGSIVEWAQVLALVVQTVIMFVAVRSIWPKKIRTVVYPTFRNIDESNPMETRHEWYLAVRNLGPDGITDVKVSELPDGESWFDSFPKKARVPSWGEGYIGVDSCMHIPLGNLPNDSDGNLASHLEWVCYIKIKYRTLKGVLVTERKPVSYGPVSQKLKSLRGT